MATTMTTTAIFTRNDATNLRIETAEEVLNLVPMAATARPIRLSFGANTVVVPAGVFKLQSKRPVQVVVEGAGVTISALDGNIKDQGWPDPLTLAPGVDPTDVRRFFEDARSDDAP